MRKKNKTVFLSQRLTRFLVLPMLTVWLFSMALLTWAVGRDFALQLENCAWQWVNYAGQEIQSDIPGGTEQKMLERMMQAPNYLSADPLLPFVLPQKPDNISPRYYLFWSEWDAVYGYQAAFGFYDHRLQPILTSAGQYLLFSYSLEPGEEETAYAYIDFSTLPEGTDAVRWMINDFPGGMISYDWDQMRAEGTLDGVRFTPAKLDESGLFYYENPEHPSDTVLYSSNVWGYHYNPGTGFLYEGHYYKSPAELLDRHEIKTDYNFFSTVIFVGNANTEFLTYSVVHCSPFLYAVQRLWPVYLVSGILLTVCLVLLRKRLKQEFWEPLRVINRSFEKDRTELSDFAASPIAELQELAEHFSAVQPERHELKNECRRLQTALDYAKDAEDNRKKLVSAVAHELKTPIAVIHSYTEGLQEGIAPGKEEQYLDTIRQETLRLDALVLEMLELSRLEAGKASLNVQQFSLLKLCQNVLARLEPAIEAKQLQVETKCSEDFPVSADEKRMEQVISNLLTNAVKYTPAQGRIMITILQHGGFAHFLVENQCPNLSEEDLSKVFDSFYRTDAARDRTGTGLGLAIVKSILALHRGECEAKNTKNGVEFSFRIPL